MAPLSLRRFSLNLPSSLPEHTVLQEGGHSLRWLFHETPIQVCIDLHDNKHVQVTYQYV